MRDSSQLSPLQDLGRVTLARSGAQLAHCYIPPKLMHFFLFTPIAERLLHAKEKKRLEDVASL